MKRRQNFFCEPLASGLKPGRFDPVQTWRKINPAPQFFTKAQKILSKEYEFLTVPECSNKDKCLTSFVILIKTNLKIEYINL